MHRNRGWLVDLRLGLDADAVGLRHDRQNHVRGLGNEPRIIGLNVLRAGGVLIRRPREEPRQLARELGIGPLAVTLIRAVPRR